MNIGITGSHGFIGKNLINRLKTKHELYEFTGNISDLNDIDKFFKNNLDAIFHLAGAIPKYDKDGNNLTKSYSINQIGIKNIVKIASKSRTKIIFPSSVAVYGKNSQKPITENTSLAPSNEYGISKMKSEEIIKEQFSNNQFVILRFSNIYGPELLRRNLIRSIAKSMIEKNPLRLNLASNSLLDFLFIDDAVTSLELSLNCTGTYNIGSGSSITLKEIINIFQKVSGNNIPINFNENNKFDIMMDITKAKIEMGFKSIIVMYEGIKLVLDSCKKNEK